MSELKVNSIKGTGASTAAITIDSSSGGCTANITNNLSNRNVVINGEFRVNQRGDQTGLTGTQYTLDRWNFSLNNGGTWSVSQSTDTPDEFANSIKLDCTTADTSLGASDYILFRQKLEGQDSQAFAKGTSSAKQFAVSFYVKTNKSGVYTVELRDNDNSRTCAKTFTVSDANWNRYTLIFPADTTGVFGNDNGESLQLNFWLGGGSTFTSGTLQTTWGSQTNANRISSSNVNIADSTSNEFFLTGVQLEVDNTGSGVATNFEHRSYNQELALCQRYFVRLGYGAQYAYVAHGIMANNTSPRCGPFILPTTMRAAPTATKVGDLTVDSETAAGTLVTAISSAQTTVDGGRLDFTCNSHSAGAGQSIHIYSDTATSGLDFSSEL